MPGTVATVNRVAATTATVTLCAANQSRKGLIIYNHSSQVLFIKFGTGATDAVGTEDFTEAIPANWQGRIAWGENYEGIITGTWAASDATGCALVTELVN